MADTTTRYESFELDGAWLVYPRGDKLDLTDRVRPVAAFTYEAHAREFCARMWPGTGEAITSPVRYLADTSSCDGHADASSQSLCK